jgi:hypothetical protein
MSDYNRIETRGIPEGLQAEGEACPACGAEAEARTCSTCGVSGWIIDCGHYAQPRPIAAGREDGSELDRDFCGDCARRDA